MANLTVTVAVATGTQYQVGGSGNVFTFDGSQPASYTFPWVKTGTVRLEQSGSSNDGHPLIFSTSNSTTLGTMQAGIISSGVTYYLDGSSNQSDYTNTSTFNAATTRYIEIAPSAETDFYFACWVHGISMGGIVDITQDTWGALSWGDGGWERQNDLTLTLTGVEATSSVGAVSAFNSEGWGRETWSQGDWGTNGTSVTATVTGVSATTSLGSVTVEDDIEVGWGRKTWGNLAWGDAYSIIPTGVEATTSVGSVTIGAGVTLILTGVAATSSVGSVTTGQGVGVSVTGVEATSAVGSVSILENEVVIPTGVVATSAVGTIAVIGGTVATPTGVEATISLGNERAYTDITVVLSGLGTTSAVGTARQASVYKAPTPNALTSAVGSVVYISDVIVNPTGVEATISTTADGSIDGLTALAYSTVDKGDSITYTEVRKQAA